MKLSNAILSVLLICLFSSFSLGEDCLYAGSNINYINTQTKKAIDAEELHKSKYYTYKALTAIYKTQKELKNCGCQNAAYNLEESQYLFKKASKVGSLREAKALLISAQKKAKTSLKELQNHHLHERYESDINVAIDSAGATQKKYTYTSITANSKAMYQIIDQSLLKYRKSLDNVVNTLDCSEALAYANGVFEHCEGQLLRTDLSDVKKYYNLQTKKITEEALVKLKNCNASNNNTQVASTK